MGAHDLITLSEAKQEISGLDVSLDEDLLAGYISACSLKLDSEYGPVVERSYTEIYETNAQYEIVLRHRPIVSVETVTEYSSTGVATVLSADTLTTKHGNGYWFNASKRFNNRLARKAAGVDYLFPWYGAVEVAYTAGRFASTATVSELWKHACRLMVATNWAIQQGSGSVTWGSNDLGMGAPIPLIMPKAVVGLLAAEKLPPGVA